MTRYNLVTALLIAALLILVAFVASCTSGGGCKWIPCSAGGPRDGWPPPEEDLGAPDDGGAMEDALPPAWDEACIRPSWCGDLPDLPNTCDPPCYLQGCSDCRVR